ncbi:MAG: sigma-70 family RNA polymerase sigma factor [Chloroflexi bacterium]|nr:sigma-70 family RNA polymerase sigma factor [Chloroflexota bacterium]
MTAIVTRSTRHGRAADIPAGTVDSTPAVVLFGDVVGSRRYVGGAASWLASLSDLLDEHYGAGRLARFDFTQGDEIQGLLSPGADPIAAVLIATLADDAPPMRWVVVAGTVEPGVGPATRRTGPAFILARETIGLARHRRDGLLVRTTDSRLDELLEGTAPVLAELLGRLTKRQRTVARLMLVEGSNQAEVADALGVARATISVSYQRAGLRSITRLTHVVRTLIAEGAQVARLPDTVAS